MFYIQYLYLTDTTQDSIFENGLTITLLALAFSVCAIVFGVLTVLVRIFNGCLELIRRRYNEDFHRLYIEFSFKSTIAGIIKPHHVHTKQLLADGIRLALQIELSQVEIVYIQLISAGIKVVAKFKYLTEDGAQKILKELMDPNSELFQTFHKECAKLLKIEDPSVRLEVLRLHTKQEQEITDGADDSDDAVDTKKSDVKSHIEFGLRSESAVQEASNAPPASTLEDF